MNLWGTNPEQPEIPSSSGVGPSSSYAMDMDHSAPVRPHST